jgi:MFS superfamily sulfate permease-like transporter
MVGYRRPHNYPHGTPFPLFLLAIVMAILAGLWVFLVPGHWPRAIAIIAVFLVIAFIDTKLHRHYER